jgi:vacuolar-type H+-ATPase subunit H
MAEKNNSLQEIEKLIEVYRKARQEILRTIAEKEAKGNVTWFKKTMLEQVEKQLARLDQQAKEWAESVIPQAYQAGLENVNSSLGKLILDADTTQSNFAQLHTEAITALVLDTLDDLHEANTHTRNNIRQVVNRAVDNAVLQKIAQGQTVRECKKAIISDLLAKGIEGVEGKSGRVMTLDAYAGLVARGRTREATNMATVNQLTALGRDLVKLSSHKTACPICAVLQGRVFSISGKDPRYPPLSMAFSGPYSNIHPNCSHVLEPYIEELADDPEGDREFSNRPLNVDDRSRKEIDRYNEMRKKKQRLRDDRRQWERYTLALPDGTPKNFATFSRWKRENSDKWQSLQADYKKALRNIRRDDIIKTGNSTQLPGFKQAELPADKFRRYALDKSKDYDKAVAFEKALGYTKDNYRELQQAIKDQLETAAATKKGSNQYGDKYEVVMNITGPNGKTAKVLTGWLVNSQGTRMVTVHVDD